VVTLLCGLVILVCWFLGSYTDVVSLFSKSRISVLRPAGSYPTLHQWPPVLENTPAIGRSARQFLSGQCTLAEATLPLPLVHFKRQYDDPYDALGKPLPPRIELKEPFDVEFTQVGLEVGVVRFHRGGIDSLLILVSEAAGSADLATLRTIQRALAEIKEPNCLTRCLIGLPAFPRRWRR